MVGEKGENKIDVDEALVQKLDDLVRIQDEVDKMEEQTVSKILEIENMYKEKLKPFHINRNEIVKNIPGFWRVAFTTHPVLRPLLISLDHKIFEHLKSLEVKDVNSGYSVVFNFDDSNRYFKNTRLTKTFKFLPDGTTEITLTPIEWEPLFAPKKIGSEPENSLQAFLYKLNLRERFDEPNHHLYFLSNPDGDEAHYEKVTKKSELENNQLQDSTLHFYEMLVKNEDVIAEINEEAMHKVFEAERLHSQNCKTAYDERKKIIGTIPDFWRIAFLSHPVLTSYINGDDEKIFKSLTSLEVEGIRDVNPGYSITLIFGDNDYFENTELKKTCKFLNEGIEITTTLIRWKEGKEELPYVDHRMRCNRKPLSYESFFAWFSPQEAMAEDLKDVIADSIKEDLWPNPLSYFYTEPPGGDEADNGMDLDTSPNTLGVEKNRKRGRIEDDDNS